jgi:hypothetical protein
LATATFPAATEGTLLGWPEAGDAGMEAVGLPGALAEGFEIADEVAVGAVVGVTSIT